MISVEEIKKKAEKLLKDYLKFLSENSFSGEGFFPLEIRANTTLSENLKERMKELSPIIKASKNESGKGFSLETTKINTRKNGEQTVIKRIFFETENDFLDFIKAKKIVENFKSSALFLKNKIRDSDVDIDDWILSHIQELSEIKENDFWQNIVECVNFLRRNKKSNFYIREIPVSVHTKFIENNKNLIHSLISEEKIETTFEKEHGLKEKPILVRFRSLDENLKLDFCGFCLEEISIPIENFKNLEKSFLSKIKNVVFVENEMIFLTFPQQKDSICVWGKGYSVLDLNSVSWFLEKGLFYFGDLDEHGFDILSKFRSHFKSLKSIFMDKKTLFAFDEFRVKGKSLSENENLAILQSLTESEKECFFELRKNPKKNRLEQERINQEYLNRSFICC